MWSTVNNIPTVTRVDQIYMLTSKGVPSKHFLWHNEKLVNTTTAIGKPNRRKRNREVLVLSQGGQNKKLNLTASSMSGQFQFVISHSMS